jgi:MYXO-CTERM domain-containing protein
MSLVNARNSQFIYAVMLAAMAAAAAAPAFAVPVVPGAPAHAGHASDDDPPCLPEDGIVGIGLGNNRFGGHGPGHDRPAAGALGSAAALTAGVLADGVSPVPEPPAAVLVAGGLAGLAWRQRRRAQAAQSRR